MNCRTPYGHMVNEYYVARVRELMAQRAQVRARVKTRKQALALVADVRRRISRCFAPFPARTPLTPRITGMSEGPGYTMEKVILHSRPNFPVTANLYIPKGRTGKMPAVLAACGHSQVGKAAEYYQSFSMALARQGFVTLIYDPISQGERCQFLGQKGSLVPKGCCAEHNMLGNQMHLTGDFMGTWRVWDGIRSLDYLLSRSEVDRTRVGVTGNSGGGTLSTYLSALDPRFTMAGPSCFVTTYLHNLENELPADSEQIPPGILKAGCDIADFFIARAPRPTILMGQKNDFFDARGTVETWREVRKIYSLLGAAEKVKVFVGPRGHGYHIENREAMYRFFCRHAGLRFPGKEPSVKPGTPQGAFCTPRGQVNLTSCRGVFDMTSSRASLLTRKQMSSVNLKKAACAILNIKPKPKAPYYRILRPAFTSDERLVQSRFALESEPGIRVELCCITRENPLFHFPEGHTASLYVPNLSAQNEMNLSLHNRLGKGAKVFSLDPRGIGAAWPQTCRPRNFFDPYGTDYFYASHGIMLGEPYVGRRVHDVLSALALLRAKGYGQIHLVGRGMGAILAAFAALLFEDVSRLSLINPLLSFHELTQTPVYRWPVSCLPRGILKQLDLPDVYRALEKNGLTLANPWDPKMRAWKREACKKHARALGISGRCIRFQPGA